MTTRPPQKALPHDFEEMDFTIENEEWNEYELKDGARIKGRVFLSKVLRDPNNPQDMRINISKPVWVVYAPTSLRGEPNHNPGQPLVGPKYEVHVNRNHEPWNVYRIVKTGQKVKIKLSIDEVRKYTDKFDKDRMPVYNVPNGVAVSISKPDLESGQ